MPSKSKSGIKKRVTRKPKPEVAMSPTEGLTLSTLATRASSSDHKTGFIVPNQSALREGSSTEEHPASAVLPPQNPEKVSHSSITQRLRKILATAQE